MPEIDPWYLDHLACPVDRTRLDFDGRRLVSKGGRAYPVVEGVPVMLVADREQTIATARASLAYAWGRSDLVDQRLPHLYLDTLGLGSAEKDRLVRLAASGGDVDPVVLMRIRRTSGNAYGHLVGDADLRTYPIPRLGLPHGQGRSLLDIGCNWGRWSIAAAQTGYRVIGLDPSLGAVMAARRIARQLKLDIRCVVGDARWLPFPEASLDTVYAYSVLQHLSESDARTALTDIGRVLRPGGTARIQMANRAGLRSLQQQMRRRFREPKGFEVRYWSLRDLRAAFETAIGPTQVTSDCYFGLGWQWDDRRYMPVALKPVLLMSEALRRLSDHLPPMRGVADSVFCTAIRDRQASRR